jgi:hypothetical protein
LKNLIHFLDDYLVERPSNIHLSLKLLTVYRIFSQLLTLEIKWWGFLLN